MIYLAGVVYVVVVLFFVGTTAFIVRAWTRMRYWHKSPSDLHYIAAGSALLASAGAGVFAASQIVLALGMRSKKPDITVHKEDVDYNLAVNDDQF